MSNKKNNSIQCSEEEVNRWLYDYPMKCIMEGRCHSADDLAVTQLNRFMTLSMEQQSLVLYKVFHDLYKEVDEYEN